MSNINPLFILLVGASILSLILVTGSTSVIFAQDEEEEEKDDKDDEKEKEEEEKEESKDEDKEKDDEKEDESKDKEEEKEKDENNSNDTSATSTQIIQDQLPLSTAVNNNDTATDVINTTTITTTPPIQQPEPIAMTPPPVEETAIINKEFNATCKCMTTTSTPPLSKPTDPPPTTTPPQPQNNNEQIPITTVNIQDSKSFGQVTDPAYTNFYTVPNLLDNVINDVSFWSQAGPSSFYIKLDNTLDNYQVCSAELNVHNPKSVPYLLDVGVSTNYSGVIDQTNERIQFDKCVKNMDEIYMIFDNPSGSFVSIAEIKLFGSKLGTSEGTPAAATIPTLQPIISTPPTENATKINIENSMAEVDIKNSTITFKFDPLTATFIGSK